MIGALIKTEAVYQVVCDTARNAGVRDQHTNIAVPLELTGDKLRLGVKVDCYGVGDKVCNKCRDLRGIVTGINYVYNPRGIFSIRASE